MQGPREKLEYSENGKGRVTSHLYSLFAFATSLKDLNTLNSLWPQGNQIVIFLSNKPL